MPKTRGKWTVLSCFLLATGVLALSAYAYRERVLEIWYVHRLDSEDAEKKKKAIAGLSSFGADYCVSALVDAVDDGPLQSEVVSCLGDVCSRCSRKNRETIVTQLLKLAEIKEPDPGKARHAALLDALTQIAQANVESVSVLFESLSSDDARAQALAAPALAAAYTAFPEEVASCFRNCTVKEAHSFFMHHLPGRDIGIYGGWRTVAEPVSENARAIGDLLRRSHAQEKVRALAMSFLVVQSHTGASNYTYGAKVVADTYARDRSALVKVAALRLTGFVGDLTGGLDLTRLLLMEGDPVLLEVIIQARTLWASYRYFFAFELWDGFLCDWLPHRQNARGMRKRWEKGELARLRELLLNVKRTSLRDAASLALASRYRDMRRKSKSPPEPVRVPTLRVHEWGVWIDRQGVSVTPGKILADLPGFVHRSTVPIDRLWDERTFTPMFITKPVVFFHTETPLSLYVRLRFHEGRPWTYYPRPTDYALGMESIPLSIGRRAPSSIPAPVGPETTSLKQLYGKVEGTESQRVPIPERPGFKPPWIPTLESESAPTPRVVTRAGLQRDLYDLVPWVTAHHRRAASVWGSGSGSPGNIGLEWCGLRIGYSAPLEGALPDIDAGHWWSHVRRAGTSLVAARGDRDRLLFYDGSANIPSPLLVRWLDTEEKTLLLQVQPFDRYPEPARGIGLEDAWWYPESERERRAKTQPIPAVFVLQAEDGGRLRGCLLEGLSPTVEPVSVQLSGLDIEGAALTEAFRHFLVKFGLTSAEAQSLVATWQREFFETPGLRVLTVLPQWIYDVVLPMEVLPAPGEMVRLGIVWTECESLPQVEGDGTDTLTLRWGHKPWNMPESECVLEGERWTAGSSRQLVLVGKGEVELREGKPGVPRLSDDGRKIAFAAIEGTVYRVFVADLDAATLTRIFQIDGVKMRHPGSVSFSGDGRTVAFAVQTQARTRAWLIDLEQRRVFNLGDREPYLHGMSTNGERLLFSQGAWGPGRKIGLLDRSRNTTRTLLTTDGPGLAVDFCLSRNGQRVAFACDVTGDREIYLVDLQEETILNVSQATGEDTAPSLSEDGMRILFESHRDRDPEIYLADLKEKTLVNLTERAGRDRFPSLSPDGKTALYRDWDSGFCILDLESRAKRIIPGTRGVWTMDLSANARFSALVRWRDEVPYLCIREVPQE